MIGVLTWAVVLLRCSYELARQVGLYHGFTEPVQTDAGKTMALKRFSVESYFSVLVAEDVMTTGGTTLKTINAIEKAGATVLPFICVIVNRSGKKDLEGRQIISLVERELPQPYELVALPDEEFRRLRLPSARHSDYGNYAHYLIF